MERLQNEASWVEESAISMTTGTLLSHLSMHEKPVVATRSKCKQWWEMSFQRKSESAIIQRNPIGDRELVGELVLVVPVLILPTRIQYI